MVVRTAAEYAQQLKALLPPGAAWEIEPDSVWDKAIAALAEEFALADARAADLMVEALPETVTELLPEWEAALALPGDGSEAERRGDVQGALTAIESPDTAAYVAIAAAMGIPITITKFTAFRVGYSAVGSGIGGSEWIYTWEVHAPAATSAEARAALEARFTHIKRAHSIVVFAYDA